MQNGWLCRSANLSSNDPICVANADAVLLWPYLRRFFDQVGLLEEGKFLSACARVRGVMLVQYLGTGSTEAEELQLTLPKILCGVPIETVVPLHINLKEQERSVSEDLLNAVCRNWPPMNNSSIASLREAFLERGGKLTKTEPNIYKLDVSPGPYDMLLDQLPWQIGTVQLNHMPAPITVHWSGL